MNEYQAYYAARAAHDQACDHHKKEMDELKASHSALVAACEKLIHDWEANEGLVTRRSIQALRLALPHPTPEAHDETR